jgi:menaquinone-dependent protoporphyrinogen oxidase
MLNVPVFYATTEGQTRLIAEAIASVLREEGLESEARELSPSSPPPDWLNIRSAVVGASLHGGRHQRTAARFLEREARHLAVRPAAFFSVSLSAGSTNPAEVDAAHAIARDFVRSARWEPRRIACFAGKLAYTQYGFFKRLVLRFIAAREGAPTDTSRDYEFTDWAAVRGFARAIADDVHGRDEHRVAS